MDTNINFTNDLNGESDSRISFNLTRKIYNLTAGRAVADGAIAVESESCTYETMLNIDRARLLNEASLLLLPNTYKEGKLYSHKPLNGNGDFTATRATTATRINSSGLVESVALNVPRLDYSLGGCPNILLEPQRTNLVFPSATATNQTRLVTAVAHTLSFYGTGSVILSGAAIGTLVGTGANNRVTLTFTPTSGNLILTVIGLVTNWQLEAGTYATSFIPTTTASVTRNADSITRNNIFTNGLITAAGGTWFVELRNDFIALRSASGGGIFINTGTASNAGNGFSIRNGDSTLTRFGINKFVGGVFTPLFVLSTSDAKIAIKWNGTTADVFVNGVKVVAATSFTPIAMENLIMEGSQKLAFINEMALFPTPLTDAQCLALTA